MVIDRPIMPENSMHILQMFCACMYVCIYMYVCTYMFVCIYISIISMHVHMLVSATEA